MLCVGLFGTCDKNRWRDQFMVKYDELGIEYFNPMVDDWHAGMVPLEAKHLAEDEIVLFPILGWSYAEGSLSEMGFGPLKAMRQNMNRSFVFYVETTLHERLTDPDRCKASLRSRELVLGHLAQTAAPNIYVVRSIDEMLDVSIQVYQAHKVLQDIRTGMTG
jgi:hypothetical protein